MKTMRVQQALQRFENFRVVGTLEPVSNQRQAAGENVAAQFALNRAKHRFEPGLQQCQIGSHYPPIFELLHGKEPAAVQSGVTKGAAILGECGATTHRRSFLGVDLWTLSATRTAGSLLPECHARNWPFKRGRVKSWVGTWRC